MLEFHISEKKYAMYNIHIGYWPFFLRVAINMGHRITVTRRVYRASPLYAKKWAKCFWKLGLKVKTKILFVIYTLNY